MTPLPAFGVPPSRLFRRSAPMNFVLESVSGLRMRSRCTAATPSIASSVAMLLAGTTAATPP